MSSDSQDIRRTILAKWNESLSKYGNLFSSNSISGTSPPSVFVGSYNYPKVFVGPMVPPIHGDTSLLDNPEKWKGKSLEEIVNFRLKLIRGIQKISIDFTEEVPENFAVFIWPMDQKEHFHHQGRHLKIKPFQILNQNQLALKTL